MGDNDELRVPEVDRCVQGAVKDGIFTGAAVMASVDAEPFHRAVYGTAQLPPPRQRLTDEAVFDLASLAKPLGAGLLAMQMVGKGRLDLNAPLSRTIPLFQDKKFDRVTIDMLLEHSSGWQADVDFWSFWDGERVDVDGMKAHLAGLDFEAAPGERTVYSDVGFMALGWILEGITGKPLDVILEREIYRPLGLSDSLFFVRHREPQQQRKMQKRTFVATEDCARRDKRLVGEVHDPKAWLLGGVAGHAGLFGTVEAVWTLADTIRRCFAGEADFIAPPVVKRFFKRTNRIAQSTRTLGWDTPSAQGSLAGGRASKQTVGHLGFTGTSVWIDLIRGATTVVLSNSVHPSPEGKKPRMQDFRRRVQDHMWREAELIQQQNPGRRGSGAF